MDADGAVPAGDECLPVPPRSLPFNDSRFLSPALRRPSNARAGGPMRRDNPPGGGAAHSWISLSQLSMQSMFGLIQADFIEASRAARLLDEAPSTTVPGRRVELAAAQGVVRLAPSR